MSTALNFFPSTSGPVAAFTAGQYVRVVLTRDSGTNAVVGYVNGAQQFTFIDGSNIAVFSAANSIINFFQDDSHTSGNESSAGAVDLIRIYDGALTSTEVAALGGPVTAAPEPSTFVIFGTALASVAGHRAWRKRKRIAVA